MAQELVGILFDSILNTWLAVMTHFLVRWWATGISLRDRFEIPHGAGAWKYWRRTAQDMR